jgi:voltage-gated potassium channel
MEPDIPKDPPNPAGIRARLGMRSTPAEPLRLADLPKGERRRAVIVCAASVALAWILIFGAYAALPIARESGLRAFTRLGVDIALVGAVLAWQIRRIAAARLPELRAVEALGVVIALFLALFSSIYLAMSHESGGTFTQGLDHVRALYFTVSIFSTVGFGDITPRTDTARLVVAAQMLLDLAIIGAVVRLIFSAARSRVAPGASPSATIGEAG